MFSFDEHSNDLFLIGGCSSQKEQMEWVFKNRLYNVRNNANLLISHIGSLDSLPIPRFVLIYEKGSFSNKHLYECLGVLEKSQQEMKTMGYKNPNGSYVTYILGDEHHIPPRINLKAILRKHQQGNIISSGDYNPVYKTGKDIAPYMKPEAKRADTFKIGRPIRVGSLFSGIGAFEEALNQLKIPHEIKFACDTGEIELVLLDNQKDRKKYKDLNRRIRKLNLEEKEQLNHYKETINKKIEEIRQICYTLPKEKRTRFVKDLYAHYEGDRRNYVKESYLANYDINPNDFHTDIRFMRGDDYAGQVDILVGGSPCQSFSTYGKKQGLEDARGTLFYDYARIIKETQPKLFIYENVAAIKSNDNGYIWETMLSVWESLGYRIFPDILNAVDYDHPQLRRRVFIVGIRADICTTDYQFPAKKKLTKKSADFLEKGPIPLKYYLGEGGFTWITTYEKHKRRSRVNQDIIGCQTANQQDNWIGDFRIEHPLPEHYADPRIFIGKYDFQDGKGMVDAVGRKLTPRECLRLMGFSDKFRIVVDDHQAYHQSGNSIVVPVLKEIILTLIPYLKENA